MAKKIKLNIDFSQDNTLIAVSCHKRDYWLAYQLNHAIKLGLRRINDLPYFSNVQEEFVKYPLYFSEKTDQQISLYLISNYNTEGKLFPDHKTMDFFLLIQGIIDNKYKNELISKIRKINGVLTAYEPGLNKIKNFNNFLSDLEMHMMECFKN
ncbi:MAG: IPExxxVDY family protein [Bacteroidales bacterium]|nr:IPExxxVDY family protein [Bacteroidales bacterium]